MPVAAGEDEPGRHRGGPAASVAPAAVHVADPIRGERVREKLEQAGLHRSQQPAFGIGAAQPAREQGHGHTHPGPLTEGVGRLGDVGRGTQRLHRCPQLRPHRREQPLLRDDPGLGRIPLVQPAHHHRQVGHVGDRPHTVGVQELVGAQLADPQTRLGHDALPPAMNGGSWVMARLSSSGSRSRRTPARRRVARSGRSSAASCRPPGGAAAPRRHPAFRAPVCCRPAVVPALAVRCATGRAGRPGGVRPRRPPGCLR